MIKGIGVDITDNRRMNDKIAKRILSDEELVRYNSYENEESRKCYLGSRFAAKEAIFKATNILIPFKNISILNGESGAPYAKLPIDGVIHISLSHEKEYSIAYVIYEE